MENMRELQILTLVSLIKDHFRTDMAVREVSRRLGLVNDAVYMCDSKALQYKCPKCDSAEGQKCVTSRGRHTYQCHTARIRLMRDYNPPEIEGKDPPTEVVAGVLNLMLRHGGNTATAAHLTAQELGLGVAFNVDIPDVEVRSIGCPYCGSQPHAPCHQRGNPVVQTHRQRHQAYIRTLDPSRLYR